MEMRYTARGCGLTIIADKIYNIMPYNYTRYPLHYIPARAARGKEEPVHEDALAVVVGVVGEQPVPLVLLLALAVARAPQRPRNSEERNKLITFFLFKNCLTLCLPSWQRKQCERLIPHWPCRGWRGNYLSHRCFGQLGR